MYVTLNPENVKISSEGVWAAIRAVNDPFVNEISETKFGENVGLFSWGWGGGGAFWKSLKTPTKDGR
jgi:hypothetical protein